MRLGSGVEGGGGAEIRVGVSAHAPVLPGRTRPGTEAGVFVPHPEAGRMAGELVLVLFVWGMVAFAVAIDASRRGHHGGFWAVLTLFTGPFGALLYGLVALVTNGRPDDGPEPEPEPIRVCPACSSEHDDSSNYCGECGAELGSEHERPVGRRLMTGSRRYCSNCRSEVGREADTCPSCGAVF